jgi:hypothetical protein
MRRLILATFRLSSPAWLAQPIMTSSMADKSKPGFFLIKPFKAIVNKSSVRTVSYQGTTNISNWCSDTINYIRLFAHIICFIGDMIW